MADNNVPITNKKDVLQINENKQFAIQTGGMIKEAKENNLLMEDNSINKDELINDFPPLKSTKEIEIQPKSACCGFLISFALIVIAIVLIVIAAIVGTGVLLGTFIPLAVIMIIISVVLFCTGIGINGPKEETIISCCEQYVGTVKEEGCFWAYPFRSKSKVSLVSNNFNGNVIKINDKMGNPIKMACIIIWRIRDTAKATYDVRNLSSYLSTQSESALRYVGCMFPYDKADCENENDLCLCSGSEEINKILKRNLSERLSKTGIEVEEARITELSYSNEIANIMLKKQAANAIVASREKIVKGAVNIVGDAVASLKANNICNLSQDEQSRLVSNMLVVLCSDNQVTPTIHTGSG